MSLTAVLFFTLLTLIVAVPPAAIPTSVRAGLGGEDCEINDDCEGGSACVTLTGDLIELCRDPSGDEACRCYPAVLEECAGSDGRQCLKNCEDDEDCSDSDAKCITSDDDEDINVCVKSCEDSSTCDDGTTCAFLEDDNRDVAICVADALVKDADLEEKVCVDAGALQHMAREELVYDRHVRASVLCDVMGSCATAGHIVRFEGKAMMMKSYCELVGGCVGKRIYVNSPRYRRGLAVETKTKGLVYTAFAARYETRAEEKLLSTAVHVGL